MCDKPANSKHHIKPRSEGGSDEPRNIVMLCQSCHDEVEGLEFTPSLIEKMRRQNLGAEVTNQEKYWWLVRDNGLMFVGIKLPKEEQLIHYDIFFTYGSQLPLRIPVNGCHNNQPIAEYPKAGKGRPKKMLTLEEMQILLSDGESLRDKALRLGTSHETVRRKLRELQGVYR